MPIHCEYRICCSIDLVSNFEEINYTNVDSLGVSLSRKLRNGMRLVHSFQAEDKEQYHLKTFNPKKLCNF
jgi:hypothetical protein